jgi:hypothetical protein
MIGAILSPMITPRSAKKTLGATRAAALDQFNFFVIAVHQAGPNIRASFFFAPRVYPGPPRNQPQFVTSAVIAADTRASPYNISTLLAKL